MRTFNSTIGTIERGHIYFFYRPRVEYDQAESLDDVRNLHMLLIPRPPDFATADESSQNAQSTDTVKKSDPTKTEEAEMKVLAPGADAVPSWAPRATSNQFYRLITIGKKKLPNPSSSVGKRKETFWATVTSVGDNLGNLVEKLGPREYETKTRGDASSCFELGLHILTAVSFSGTRHEAAARLAARGGYAIVNTEARTPSQRETHLGYNISHPSPETSGDVQAQLGIFTSSSFVLQVKNPHAPSTAPGMGHTKAAEYPQWIMKDVFGEGEGSSSRGRESYGLRFASVETPELLNFVGAELLLIAAREGEQGLETSLGGGRGEGMTTSHPSFVQITLPELFDQHLRSRNVKSLYLD